MSIKLTYALKDNNIVHISEVSSRLKCECICPSCKSILVARKGSKVNYHFAHHNSDDCGRGYETSLQSNSNHIIPKLRQIELALMIKRKNKSKE